MKVFVTHSRDFDFEAELYEPIRSSGLNTKHDFFLPHENVKSVNTKAEIQNSGLVLAEVSFPSTGQGIELGWANMMNVPILCISKEVNKISGSLGHLTKDFVTYSSPEDLIGKLEKFLG